MTPKITKEIRDAVNQHPDRPIELQDEQNQAFYVLMSRDLFQRYIYDDSELTPDEMTAAAGQFLDDPDTWAAPGMDAYDSITDSKSP